VWAIRFPISAEYEAIQLYMQLDESIDEELSRKVLLISPTKSGSTPANFCSSCGIWTRKRRSSARRDTRKWKR
jgi:hypothetical protein